jgi:Amino acid permease
MLLALVFARLGRSYPQTGGPYAYSRRAFGDFVGFQTAWGYWIAIWAGNAAIAVAFVSYLSTFWDGLATNSLLAASVAVAAIWLLTWINALGVRQGGLVDQFTFIMASPRPRRTSSPSPSDTRSSGPRQVRADGRGPVAGGHGARLQEADGPWLPSWTPRSVPVGEPVDARRSVRDRPGRCRRCGSRT